MPEKWLRTNECLDVLSSLEHATMSLQLVPSKPREWKWVILATHSTIQGALVCVLAGSTGAGCLTDKSEQKMLEWLENRKTRATVKSPEERVAELPVLLKRSYDANRMAYLGGKEMPLEININQDILKLHSLRNQFTHFSPSSWSIETEGLPRIIRSAMLFSQRVLLNHPASKISLIPEIRAQITSQLEQVSDALKVLGVKELPDPLDPSQKLTK